MRPRRIRGKAIFCLFLASQLIGRPAVLKDPNLAGYWGFDEASSSGEIFDYSGHHGISRIHGKIGAVEGIIGNALEFQGATNFVDVLDGDWNVGAPMSLLFWFKPNVLEKNQVPGTMIEHEAGGAVAGMFICRADGTVTVCDTQARLVECGFPLIRIGEWNFAALTIDTNEIGSYIDGRPSSRSILKGLPVRHGRLTIGARGSVGDSYYRGAIDELAVYQRVISEGEIAAIYQNYKIGVSPLAPSGIEIIGLSTDKLLYSRKERGVAKVAVKNFGGQRRSAPLAVNLTSLLQTESSARRQIIDLDAGEVRVIEIPLDLSGHSMGCEVAARVGGTKESSTQREFFSVSDNLWEVGIGAPFSPAQDCQKTPAQLGKELEDLRRGYANWLEVFFWAPDDWGCLAPAKDHWWSGQSNYLIRRDSLKSLISQARPHGIKVITYGKNMACGPEGWELARRHPDWFLHDPNGRLRGGEIPFALDNWNNEDLRRGGKFHPDWMWIMPDLRNREALDWGIDQIARSRREYGWDGVRFDGHFTADNDEWTTFNTRRMKERLWQEDPGFLFGYNYGVSPNTSGKLDHEQREAMAGGGMWLQEDIGQWRYGAGLKYANWTEYVENEIRAAKQVQAAGGSYHGIYNLGSNPAQDTYKLIYALIAGGHSVYGGHTRVAGCANWGQFMTRWSAFLWDRRLMLAKLPQDAISIHGPKKVESFVQELVESAHTKFVILHLVNPASEQSIQNTTNLPPAITQIAVGFRGLAKPRRIVLIQPEAKPYDQNLKPVRRGEGYEVTVSNLTSWAMVVVEIEGNFSPLTSSSAFSGAPNIRIPSASSLPPRQFNPLWETDSELKPNEQIIETDSPSQNVTAEAVSDPEATGGLAQRKDWRAPVYMGRSWIGPLTPGRYLVNYRVKWVEERPGAEVASISITEQATNRKLAGRDITALDSKVTSPRPHKYQYHPIEITLTNTGYIHCQLITSRNFKPSPDLIFLDHVRIECLNSFSDDQLNPGPPQLPPDLPIPQGNQPKKVLLIKGLYWQPFGIEAALGCASAYTIPANPRELFSIDALILCDIDFTQTDAALRALLREYARAGGRLVFLGGPYALNLGGLRKTFLEDVLPVTFAEGDFGLDRMALPLRDSSGAPFSDRPYVFWSHGLKARPEAEILAYAGESPILSRRKTGRGQVIVFGGTVLGEGSEGQRPFWECTSWANLARRMVLE